MERPLKPARRIDGFGNLKVASRAYPEKSLAASRDTVQAAPNHYRRPTGAGGEVRSAGVDAGQPL